MIICVDPTVSTRLMLQIAALVRFAVVEKASAELLYVPLGAVVENVKEAAVGVDSMTDVVLSNDWVEPLTVMPLPELRPCAADVLTVATPAETTIDNRVSVDEVGVTCQRVVYLAVPDWQT